MAPLLHSRHRAEAAKAAKRLKRPLTPAPTLIDSLDERGTRYLTILQLLNRDGHNCYLCTGPLQPNLEVDHIIPKSRGGSNHPLNLALACKTCNARKRDLIVAFDIADRRPVFRLP